ncbi:ATP-binding protein [Pseudomonas chlororaphis subsp. aurantiaca]|nr:ATP-binding protein [Pseudomonas chlororaphis subsp. aurantiaca]
MPDSCVAATAVLDQGELIEQGPPEQIFSQPRHARPRAFLSRVL